MFTETTSAPEPIEATTAGGDADNARWQATDDILGASHPFWTPRAGSVNAHAYRPTKTLRGNRSATAGRVTGSPLGIPPRATDVVRPAR